LLAIEATSIIPGFARADFTSSFPFMVAYHEYSNDKFIDLLMEHPYIARNITIPGMRARKLLDPIKMLNFNIETWILAEIERISTFGFLDYYGRVRN